MTLENCGVYVSSIDKLMISCDSIGLNCKIMVSWGIVSTSCGKCMEHDGSKKTQPAVFH